VMAVAHAAADELKAIAGMQSAVIVRVGEGKTLTIAFNLKLRQERSFIEIGLIALDISYGSDGVQKVSEYLNAVLE